MTRAADVDLFTFENNQLAYRRFGYGPTTLLAFHGFGQTGQVFAKYENLLGDRYTLLAIDLFFHGSSQYRSNHLLTKTVWQRLIDAFLQANAVDRFSVVGFSLGGRFALTTAELLASRVDQLILIAPDGITPSRWYKFATGSSLGRRLFRFVLTHLTFLSTIGHFLTRAGLLNRTLMRFVEISLDTPERRNLVYQSWTQFRLIFPDLERVGDLINEMRLETHFFMGSFDRIIPTSYVLPLTKRLHQFELTIVKTGHNLLIELAGERLAKQV